MLNSIVIKLLNDSGKISLPTIGIFVKVDMEDAAAYLFTPSAVKVDARMVEVVMSEMDVPSDEAVNIITSYVEFIKNIISKNGKYPFKGIGDVMLNEQGIYYFIPVGAVKQSSVKVEESVKIEIEKEQVGVVVEEPEPVIEPIIEKAIVTDIVVEVKEPKQEEVVKEVVAEVKEPKQEEVVAEVKEETRLNERFQPRRLGEIMEGGANKRFYDKVHSQVVAKNIDDIVKESVVLEKIAEEVKEVVAEPVKVVEEIKVEQEIKPEPMPIEQIQPIEPIQPIESTPLQSTQSTQHELSQEALRDMLGHSKRKGLHEIYDRGAYLEKGAAKPASVQPAPAPSAPVQQPPVFVQQQESVVTPPFYVETPQVAPSFAEPAMPLRPKKKKFDFVLFISFLVIVVGLCVIAYFYYMQQELGL